MITSFSWSFWMTLQIQILKTTGAPANTLTSFSCFLKEQKFRSNTNSVNLFIFFKEKFIKKIKKSVVRLNPSTNWIWKKNALSFDRLVLFLIDCHSCCQAKMMTVKHSTLILWMKRVLTKTCCCGGARKGGSWLKLKFGCRQRERREEEVWK